VIPIPTLPLVAFANRVLVPTTKTVTTLIVDVLIVDGFVPTSITVLLEFFAKSLLSAVLIANSAPFAELVKFAESGTAAFVSLFLVSIVAI
jgi:hypothetical protein